MSYIDVKNMLGYIRGKIWVKLPALWIKIWSYWDFPYWWWVLRISNIETL